MSHTEAVQEFITDINFDRFAAIEAAHHPRATFHSFRGPNLHDSLAIEEWHRHFLRNYADCTYKEPEYREEGNTVAVAAIIEAKGYDFRRFNQRVLDIYELDENELIVGRRLYAMLRDIEMDKPVSQAHTFAVETQGGKPAKTKEVVTAFFDALLAGEADAAKELVYEKSAIIDSIHGIAAGADAIVEIFGAVPVPAFGIPRVSAITAGPNAAAVEVALDPGRPRAAYHVRVVEEKVAVVEVYWMLREIGYNPYEEYRQDRHLRRAILPI